MRGQDDMIRLSWYLGFCVILSQLGLIYSGVFCIIKIKKLH